MNIKVINLKTKESCSITADNKANAVQIVADLFPTALQANFKYFQIVKSGLLKRI